jgi:hypothetical protein
MEKSRGAFRIFKVISDGKRLLGRSPYKWKDNIKMTIKVVGRRGVD